MKVIEATVALMDEVDAAVIMKKLEECGRVCHKSEDKISETSSEDFVRKLIKLGHESVLEHVSVTFKIICDRGVMAELTRHRLASFSVESTRYCDYSSDKFGGELTFVRPCYWEPYMREYEWFFGARRQVKSLEYEDWVGMMKQVEENYKQLVTLQFRREIEISFGTKLFHDTKSTPEEARAILPMSLATTVVMTANLREWRHILKQRTTEAAHPQMRQIANMILTTFKAKLPVVFEDIGGERSADKI